LTHDERWRAEQSNRADAPSCLRAYAHAGRFEINEPNTSTPT